MKSFTKITSIITPFDKANVDTDQIVPKQFLKLVQKTGFGKFLFYNWRFDGDKNTISDFVLNDELYSNSKILVAGENFGCGSSREHAVWALMDFGFSVIIAPSFADIFHSNCFKNGLLPITIDKNKISQLLETKEEIQADLEKQTIQTNTNTFSFEIKNYHKKILLEGLDDISLTLQYENDISNFEKKSTIPSVK